MLMSVSAGPAESQTCSSTIEVMATDSHVPQTIPIFQLRHAFGRGLSPAPFPRVHWTSCQGVGGQRGTTGQWRQWSVFHYSDNCGFFGNSVRPILKVKFYKVGEVGGEGGTEYDNSRFCWPHQIKVTCFSCLGGHMFCMCVRL